MRTNRRKGVKEPEPSLIRGPIICKILNLSFQSLTRDIATRHASLGGEFGERIDSVKDAEHRVRRREGSSRP